MSKRYHQQSNTVIPADEQAEYRIIKSDLIKVIVLNLLYLAIILGLYFANKRSGAVDNWFGHMLHF